MALTRREFLSTLTLLSGLTLGCAVGVKRTASSGRKLELGATRPENPGAPVIIVCMPDTAQSREVWNGLSDELSHDYRLVAIQVERADESALIAAGIEQYRPSALLLMNNPTVGAYRKYQSHANSRVFPPSVIVMTSFLEAQIERVIGATGITYEVPLITVMTNLRRLVKLTSERVGVIVREPLRAFISKQVALANRERIVAIQAVVSARPNASELKRAIRQLKDDVDVLWILNDDRLLTPQLISEGWLPGLDERPWLPTVVGARSLVSLGHSFGTLAVLPDHVSLGSQAANLLFDMADNGWQLPADAAVQLPLSTTVTIDLAQVKERFVMRADALEHVDRVLE